MPAADEVKHLFVKILGILVKEMPVAGPRRQAERAVN